MDNGSEALGMPEVKEETSQKIRNSRNRFFLLLSLMLFLALFLTGVLYINSAKQNQNKNSLMPTPGVVKKSLKIPGFQLVVEGKVIDKKTDYLVIEEGENVRTKIYAKSGIAVSIHNVSDASDKSTSSGVLVSVLVAKETGSYEKISIGDKVEILLDEKDNQLFAESITVFREIKY